VPYSGPLDNTTSTPINAVKNLTSQLCCFPVSTLSASPLVDRFLGVAPQSLGVGYLLFHCKSQDSFTHFNQLISKQHEGQTRRRCELFGSVPSIKNVTHKGNSRPLGRVLLKRPPSKYGPPHRFHQATHLLAPDCRLPHPRMSVNRVKCLKIR